MNDKTLTDLVEVMMAKVELMREYQRNWFERKQKTDLAFAKKYEHEVDEMMRLLRKRGFKPDQYKVETKQSKIF